MAIANYLSIDVEDYFQVSAFETASLRCIWSERELRVEANTDRLLAHLAAVNVKATFFVLGWVAKRCPQLVQRIAAEGHEIASHGYGHRRVCHQSREEFRQDIRQSKGLLEDLCSKAVHGYRAPSYSISPLCFWAFDELYAAGYTYDSSIFPIKHEFYGISDWPRFSGYAVKRRDGSWVPAQDFNEECPNLIELPITTVEILGCKLPIAGGGYFRLLPYSLSRWGLRRINNQDQKPFVFYLHPWELDPDQPRMENIGFKSRFRHYLNLEETEGRFNKLLNDFQFTTIHQGLGCLGKGVTLQ